MYEIIQDFLLFLLLKIMTEKKCGTMDPKIYAKFNYSKREESRILS